jgi:hypothetical protein
VSCVYLHPSPPPFAHHHCGFLQPCAVIRVFQQHEVLFFLILFFEFLKKNWKKRLSWTRYHSWTAWYFLWRGCWCCQCDNPRSKICFEVDCMPQYLCWKRAMECVSNERGVSSSIYNHSKNFYQRQRLVYFSNHIAITFDRVKKT